MMCLKIRFECLAFCVAVTLGAPVCSEEEIALTISDDDWGNEAILVPESTDYLAEGLAVGYARWESVRTYAEESRLRSSSLPVGRLKIRRPNFRMSLCTGFFVSSDLLLTNNHCVPGNGPVLGVRFELGYLQQFGNEPFDAFDVESQPVVTSKELDFSLLRLSPGQSNLWGWMRFSTAGVEPSQPLVVYHHPNGEPMKISREGCFAGPQRMGLRRGFFLHQCDTLGGSSGAPILNEDYLVVGLHHRGTTEQGPDVFNQGTIYNLIRPIVTPHLSGLELQDRIDYAQCIADAYDSGDREGIISCVDLLSDGGP